MSTYHSNAKKSVHYIRAKEGISHEGQSELQTDRRLILSSTKVRGRERGGERRGGEGERLRHKSIHLRDALLSSVSGEEELNAMKN